MDLTGRKLGSWRLVRQLGQGGMGTVYEAVHDEIGRRAAVKVVRGHLAGDPEIIQRFFREARAVNQVAHPGLVQVFDLQRDPDGTVYSVMELLVGESLAQRLQRGPLPLVQVGTIFNACADALAAVHAVGIAHRDLKPDNIFLVRGDDGVERAKILDFGVAKLLDGADGVSTSSTGAVVGTPMYMAPEQCEGRRGVDGRADVYAMACVLFDMLTGAPPFRADSAARLLVMHLSEPAPAPSERRRGLPAALDAAVLQGLAKDPAERFDNMRAFAAAVNGALAQVQDAAAAGQAPGPVDQFAATIAPSPSSLGRLPTVAQSAPPRSGGRGRRRGWALALVAVAAIGGGALAWRLVGSGGADAGGKSASGAGPAVAAPPPATPVDPVDDEHCRTALLHAAQLLSADVPPSARPYRYLIAGAKDPAALGELAQLCRTSFDGQAVACLRGAPSSAAVARCGDELTGRRCSAGDQPACASAAAMAWDAKDWERAHTLAKAGCEQGVAAACSTLGLARLYGRGVARDLALARAAWARGADLDDLDSMAYLAYLERHGVGAAADVKGARRRLAAACAAEPLHFACTRLGELEAAGLGGAQSRSAAEARFRATCDMDLGEGCLRLGRLIARKDKAGAQAAYERARAIFAERATISPSATYHLATMHLGGEGAPADPAAALALLEDGCRQHDPLSCLALGALLVSGQVPIDVPRSRSAHEAACTDGLADACTAAVCQKLVAGGATPPRDALARCKAQGHFGPVAGRDRGKRPVRRTPGGTRHDTDPRNDPLMGL